MRSVQVSKLNGPFEIVEREIPEPGAAQVRVKVQACGICHGDSVTKLGIFPNIKYPRVPGHEIAGVVDELGSDVADWKIGQKKLTEEEELRASLGVPQIFLADVERLNEDRFSKYWQIIKFSTQLPY